ncbi:MAG: aminotransferase class I/II-fold pyridoxal phosphate-dependent enzyme, partial [Thermoleophilia bacterium]
MKRTYKEQLGQLESAGLLRRLRRQEVPGPARTLIDGREAILFSGNDYLGLSTHPEVVRAAGEALREYGSSATSARLVSGNHPLYRSLEEDLARFKGKEAALVFSSGYMANLGLIASLGGDEKTIFMDRLGHASLYDGWRLSGAGLRRFRHNDLDHLEQILSGESGGEGGLGAGERESASGGVRENDDQSGGGVIVRDDSGPGAGCGMIVTEGVFSMDGDLAPLAGLANLAKRFDCLLFVDDAHGTGVLGPEGKGTAAYLGVEPDVEVGTLSKAAGSVGGFVAGSRDMIDYLINRARPFIFSTGL